MAKMNMPREKDIQTASDEELTVFCSQGVDGAERELLSRHMCAIYWLPQRIFGTPEEELSGFLIFALEKIRERDILAKYSQSKGARFSTWLGVVVRNLYIDYLRTQPSEPSEIELQEDLVAVQPEKRQQRADLLTQMQTRCRVLFKLLLCDTFFLESDEVEWIASESGRGVVEITRALAELEENLRERETKLQERYDRLAKAYYWKNRLQRQLERFEKSKDKPNTTFNPELERMRNRLERRNREYDSLSEELSGGAGIVTAPYRELSELMNIKEGTLASNISRCRAGATKLLHKLRTS